MNKKSVSRQCLSSKNVIFDIIRIKKAMIGVFILKSSNGGL